MLYGKAYRRNNSHYLPMMIYPIAYNMSQASCQRCSIDMSSVYENFIKKFQTENDALHKYAWDTHNILCICSECMSANDSLCRHIKKNKKPVKATGLLAAILAEWFITFLTSTCCFSWGLIRSLLCVSYCNVSQTSMEAVVQNLLTPKINKVRNICRLKPFEVGNIKGLSRFLMS